MKKLFSLIGLCGLSSLASAQIEDIYSASRAESNKILTIQVQNKSNQPLQYRLWGNSVEPKDGILNVNSTLYVNSDTAADKTKYEVVQIQYGAPVAYNEPWIMINASGENIGSVYYIEANSEDVFNYFAAQFDIKTQSYQKLCGDNLIVNGNTAKAQIMPSNGFAGIFFTAKTTNQVSKVTFEELNK